MKKGEIRPLMPNQTIVYYVLYALESGCTQGCWIKERLEKQGYRLKQSQINSALQRLRKDGLAERNRGLWLRKWAGENNG